jgi:cyclopropane-fatty-acyl-phospholipid synthase
MIEAVGWKDFGTFFEICARRLEPNGAMALQAITVDDRLYAMEKASRTFIRTHVFPDGCLPSLEVIARSVARRSDLRMVALEDITDHYPETLRRWRENLDANAAELAARGYDDRFQRLWRLYLCWCEAGFAMRSISDVQIVLGKPAWRDTVSVSDSRAGTALHGEAAG